MWGMTQDTVRQGRIDMGNWKLMSFALHGSHGMTTHAMHLDAQDGNKPR